MMPKLIVLAACLLSLAAAQSLPLGDTGARSTPTTRPATQFIWAELLSFGAGPTSGYGSTSEMGNSVRLLHIGYQYDRVRLGLALLDFTGGPVVRGLPVTAGYTIYERPVRYFGSLYAKVPEVYVDATGSFINGDLYEEYRKIPFMGTLELACSVDGYGVGGSVAAGCYYYYDDASYQAGANKSGLYAVARFHLLRLRWGRGADVLE
jgi:hypothetical protein